MDHSNNLAVIGLQWGDEGKGKIVDCLSRDFDLVVRYQGGNNAGHTVKVDDHEYKLNLIPSGIIQGKECFLGQGVVLDPEHFEKEYLNLDTSLTHGSEGIKIFLSSNISIILEFHKHLDQISEKILEENKIGTTSKGIGPAYQDLVARRSIKLRDLSIKEILIDKLNISSKIYNPLLKEYGYPEINISQVVEKLLKFNVKFGENICQNNFILTKYVKSKKRILFEGAQGSLLDIMYGIYPFVTSSNTVASYIPIGSGLNAEYQTLGIFKAYSTRVGEGPFPTELFDSIGQKMGDIGAEFGTVTKRKRRCGWLDLVSLKHSCEINNVKKLCITKVDVLSNFDEIKVCISYNGLSIDEVDFSDNEFFQKNKTLPTDYVSFESWGEIKNPSKFEDLDKNLKSYLRFIEEHIGKPIEIISYGPERSETIFR